MDLTPTGFGVVAPFACSAAHTAPNRTAHAGHHAPAVTPENPETRVTVRPLGIDSSTRAEVADGRSFFANANEAADLDFIVTPTITGAESYDVLRSQGSPERLRYAAALPLGTNLERDPTSPGGLRVVRGGQVLLTIAAVYASDADGKLVAAEYEITDEGFDIAIKHRDTSAKYPILVDPSFWLDQRYWDQNGSISQKGWAFDQIYPSFGLYSTTNGGIGARALQTWNGQTYYGAGGWGRWSFVSQGDSYISNGYLGRFAFIKNANNACIDGGLMRPDQNYGSGAYFGTCSGFGAQDVGFASQAADRTNRLAMRWVSGASGFYNSSSLAYLGGAAMVIQDDRAPVNLAVSGLPANDTWTATKPTSATITAKDNGVGLSKVSSKRGSDPTADTTTCPTGANSWNPQSGDIWCPLATQTKTVPISVPEGTSSWTFGATDLVNNTSSTPYTIKLDTTKPNINSGAAGGTLWNNRNQATDRRNEILTATTPDFTIPASAVTDTGGSGVQEVEVRIKNSAGTLVHTGAATLQTPSNTWKWENALTGIPDGTYTVQVITRDNVAPTGATTGNNVATLDFAVSLDRTGDIHTGQLYGDAAGGGSPEGTEQIQTGTANERRSDGGTLSTRRLITCPTDSSRQCLEARELSETEAGDTGASTLIVRRGTSDSDTRIASLATSLGTDRGPATQTGVSLDSVLATWQVPPPGHGTLASIYERNIPNETPGDGPLTERVWVEATTNLVLRRERRFGTELDVVSYYSYAPRRTASELPSDTFVAGNGMTPSRTIDYPAQPTPPGTPDPDDTPFATLYSESEIFRTKMGLPTQPEAVIQALTDVQRALGLDLYGVLLLPSEIDELNVRNAADIAANAIDDYGQARPNEFLGAYVDQEAGGLIRVGFTNNAEQHLTAIKAFYPYPDRLRAFTAPLTATALETLRAQVDGDLNAILNEGISVTSIVDDLPTSSVLIRAVNPTQAQEQWVTTRFGSQAKLVGVPLRKAE